MSSFSTVRTTGRGQKLPRDDGAARAARPLRALGLAVAIGLGLAGVAIGDAQQVPAVRPATDAVREEVVDLPVLHVDAAATEQDYFGEEARIPFPFRGQGGFFGEILLEEERGREDYGPVSEQVAALAEFNPREFATASGAEAPRGFTTPRLRNGFNQSGFPEVILGGRRELLTGFLATYFGRTAPGGIQNHISRRPSAKPRHEFSLNLSAGPAPAVRLSAERHAPLGSNRLHTRLAGSWREQEGPQDFARQRSNTSGLVLRYAPSKETVWLVELEGTALRARPAGGLPVTRETRGARQGGPYAPLADFNTNGPRAFTHRASGSANVLWEHAAQDDLHVRAGAQIWRRTQEELRFNTGAFLLDEGIFDGVREPQYNAQEQTALGLDLEFDGTGLLPFGRHEWVAGAFLSRETAGREQRALTTEARDALPATVRFLDPLAPDWTTPAYSADAYARILAWRDEGAGYAGVFASERVALSGERIFGTVGIRHDWVDSHVDDRRPGAAVPQAGAQVSRVTHHAGVVWHAIPNQLAGFVNRSTAFQPVRRVDARTGRIIGNEGTAGFEWGWRYVVPGGGSTVTWSAYRLWNENITRNNPLYNDPVFDPQRRQPQFVSSGEERFTGTEVGVNLRGRGGLTASGKVAWVEAITTSSPDLPEEVGRQLPRLPEITAGGSLRYSFRTPGWQGLTLSAGYAWIGDHVAVYGTTRRLPVVYDDYAVVNFSAGVAWQTGPRQHAVNLAVRNVLDADLVAAAGRAGGDRGLDAGYSLKF